MKSNHDHLQELVYITEFLVDILGETRGDEPDIPKIKNQTKEILAAVKSRYSLD